MRECVYGWYPPARDIMKNYQGKPHPDPYVDDQLEVKHGRTTPHMRKYASWSRTASRASQSSDRPKSDAISLEIRGQGQFHKVPRPKSCTPAQTRIEAPHVRVHSAISAKQTPDVELFRTTPEILAYAPTPPSRMNSSKSVRSHSSHRPAKAWAMKTEETQHISDFEIFYREMTEEQKQRLTPDGGQCTHVPKSPIYIPHQSVATPDAHDEETLRERHERVKSATTYRPRVSANRPVKSAGPERCKHVTGEEYDAAKEREQRKERQQELDQMVEELTREYLPNGGVDIGKEEVDHDDEILPPKDYDEQLQKHGWRMQVHGDPLNLKGPCIPQRGAFTVKVPIPVVKPNAPKARSECYDTFFLNTIPRKPMSFTIHQDWASEVLHAKRMQLQKRDGEPYKYRTSYFSFAY